MNEPASSPPPQGKGSSCSMSVGRWERIIKIKEMVRAGANTADLALGYGIFRRMVQKNLAAARTLNRDLVGKTDLCELLGEEVDAWREFFRRPWNDFGWRRPTTLG